MTKNDGLDRVFDNLSKITRDIYLPEVVDRIFDSRELLMRLRADTYKQMFEEWERDDQTR